MSEYTWMTKYTPPPEVVRAAETVSRWAAGLALKNWRVLNCASADELTRLRAENEELAYELTAYQGVASTHETIIKELRAEVETLKRVLRKTVDMAEYWICREDCSGMSESDFKTWHTLGYGSSAMRAARAALKETKNG